MRTRYIKKHISIYYLLFFLAGLFAVSIYGCQPSREDNDLQNEHANTYLTEDEMDGYEAWVKEEKGFELVHRNLLEGVDDKIGELEAYLPTADQEVRNEVREAIEDLKSKKAALEAEMSELKQADEQNWQRVREEINEAADSLRASLDKIPADNKWDI